MALVNCVNLTKHYQEQSKDGKQAPITEVLKGVNLTIETGEQVAILGQSGSGKSTLLHIMGMLDSATNGSCLIEGHDYRDWSEAQRAEFRNRNLGFIYQFHHLLMEFDALDNVAMPLYIAGVERKLARQRAIDGLQQVGLEHRISHLPSQLSGGERQRVAIARALINKPKLILADEPTGNLDKANAEHVFDLFLQLNQQSQSALVVVTHDAELARRFDRVIHLEDGRIKEPQ